MIHTYPVDGSARIDGDLIFGKYVDRADSNKIVLSLAVGRTNEPGRKQVTRREGGADAEANKNKNKEASPMRTC